MSATDITAIICEYNPFHKGHHYQINQVKKLFPDTCLVSVMSPNFVQRGQPAVFDKFVRGECAVRCGADLAVSMPQVFALLSAEGFAEGGVRVAHKLGANALAFGVEDDNISELTKIAKILISEDFEKELKNELSRSPSESYPVLRQKALSLFIGNEKAKLISTPNNILGIEYIKAVMRYCPEMKLCPIKRTGNAHGDASVCGEILSATAIRKKMTDSEWLADVPQETHSAVCKALMLDNFRYNSFLFSAITLASYDRIMLATGNKELADTIWTSAGRFGEYELFRQSIARKKLAETKIDRALVNIMLEIENDCYMHAEPEYATLLGMSSAGRKILKKSCTPIISKFSDSKILNGNQIAVERLSDRIWARCTSAPSGEKYFIDKKPFVVEEIK